MSIKTMDDLFVETLKDIYYAEKHILKAMPSMAKKAHASELLHRISAPKKPFDFHIFWCKILAERVKPCSAGYRRGAI